MNYAIKNFEYCQYQALGLACIYKQQHDKQ